jgi:hypothetical protein
MLYLRGQRRTAAVSSDASVVCTRVCRSAMTRIAEDHGMWPSASTRTTWDPARRSRTASGVTPAACRSMNTRAPCGIESIRNEPTNNSFCVSVAVGLFLTSGETTGSFTTTRIARSAIGEVSGAAGATGIGAGGIATGSGRGVNGSARGCSDDVSHETETRITQTSSILRHGGRRGSRHHRTQTGALAGRGEWCCRTYRRRALIGKLIERVSRPQPAAVMVHRARGIDWLFRHGTADTAQSPFPSFPDDNHRVSCNPAQHLGQKSPRMSFFLSLRRYLR